MRPLELPPLDQWTFQTVLNLVRIHEFEPGRFDYNAVLNAPGVARCSPPSSARHAQWPTPRAVGSCSASRIAASTSSRQNSALSASRSTATSARTSAARFSRFSPSCSSTRYRGKAILALLHQFGTVLASSMQERLWTQHQSMLDASAPAGRFYYWKSHYLADLSDAAIDVIGDNAWHFESSYSLTLLSHMGGAIRRHSEDETAFSGRDAEFTININCGATDVDAYERDRSWVRRWFDALSPRSTGGMYVNFIPEDSGERVQDVYGESKYRRLSEIKSRYDPQNVLRVNHNIKPA